MILELLSYRHWVMGQARQTIQIDNTYRTSKLCSNRSSPLGRLHCSPVQGGVHDPDGAIAEAIPAEFTGSKLQQGNACMSKWGDCMLRYSISILAFVLRSTFFSCKISIPYECNRYNGSIKWISAAHFFKEESEN